MDEMVVVPISVELAKKLTVREVSVTTPKLRTTAVTFRGFTLTPW